MPGAVAVYTVGGGKTPVTQRFGELPGVSGPHHGKHSLDGVTVGFAERNAFESDFGIARLPEAKLRCHRSKMSFAQLDFDELRALHLDLRGPDFHLPPLAVPPIF